MNGKKVFGDYQTPLNFANEVCLLLVNKYKTNPDVVIEPTCGIGNFLQASQCFNALKYYGLEINSKYCEATKKILNKENVEILNVNYFTHGIRNFIDLTKNNLIIGNPPWVTNSELSKENSFNMPQKSNLKNLKGFDALTGASNFDVCEFIILDIIESIKNTNSTLAMLCKTSVARNIFKEISRRKYLYKSFSMYKFNSKKIFNISASACLLVVEFDTNYSDNECKCLIFNFDKPFIQTNFIDYKNSDIYCGNSKEDFLGESCFEWRQGVKHDCSKVVELTKIKNVLLNGNCEEVNIEDFLVYTLVKSSMFKQPIITNSIKKVIITQTKVGEDTSKIQKFAPCTWSYLQKNIKYFNKRKSVIYKNSPQFAIFGIGDYSFAPYKVGISGFYKEPLFSLIYNSENNKPIMTDDTVYFISFNNYETAYTAMLCLNTDKVLDFLKSISFQDSKRPYTKQILKKIDFYKIVNKICLLDLIQVEKKFNIPQYINEIMYENFKKYVYEFSQNNKKTHS